MSEIQCSNITSSKRKKRPVNETRKLNQSLDVISKMFTDPSQIENCSDNIDKGAILQLVRRNLQKICTKQQQQQQQQPDLHRLGDDFHTAYHGGGEVVNLVLFENVVGYERSRSTKELLRRTILEKRKRDYIVFEEHKIWRPW